MVIVASLIGVRVRDRTIGLYGYGLYRARALGSCRGAHRRAVGVLEINVDDLPGGPMGPI